MILFASFVIFSASIMAFTLAESASFDFEHELKRFILIFNAFWFERFYEFNVSNVPDGSTTVS